MPATDDRRYFVLTLLGDQGPFDRAGLREQLQSGAIQPTDQVRNAFGRGQGTVADVVGPLPQRASGPHPAARVSDRRPAPGLPAARRTEGGRGWTPALVIAIGLLALAAAIGVVAWSRPAPVVERPWTPPPPAAAPAAAPAPVVQPDLVLVSARYGVLPDGSANDVTCLVARAMRDGRLSILATNNLFGDPAFGTLKRLQVVYTWKGERRSKEAGENEMLIIGDDGR